MSEHRTDFDSAFSLFNKVLGENLYTKDALQAIADSEDSTILGCVDEGKFVAAAMAGRLKKVEWIFILHLVRLRCSYFGKIQSES